MCNKSVVFRPPAASGSTSPKTAAPSGESMSYGPWRAPEDSGIVYFVGTRAFNSSNQLRTTRI
jgi:hypothetical protein